MWRVGAFSRRRLVEMRERWPPIHMVKDDVSPPTQGRSSTVRDWFALSKER
jgi:hypothetical protein